MDNKIILKKKKITKLFNNEKKYVCKKCGKSFDSGRGLGGHCSKIHSGKVWRKYAKDA